MAGLSELEFTWWCLVESLGPWCASWFSLSSYCSHLDWPSTLWCSTRQVQTEGSYQPSMTELSSLGKSVRFDNDVYCFRQDEFSSISLALAQTFVMTVGELNYQSTFLNAYENSRMAFPGVTYFIFVLFVLLMPILLMNLMVGHLTLACWKLVIIVNDGCNLFGGIRLICLNHIADWFGCRRYCRGTEKCRVEEDSHAGELTGNF